jgi:hypothetical protein
MGIGKTFNKSYFLIVTYAERIASAIVTGTSPEFKEKR